MATSAETEAAIKRVANASKEGRRPSQEDRETTHRAAQQAGERGGRAQRALGDPDAGSWGVLD